MGFAGGLGLRKALGDMNGKQFLEILSRLPPRVCDPG